ncbi:hypothetical protein SAMN05421790_10825 [Kroppenstedtia eburnea]|uniref:Uncharacterized protein n=1 Tax=Kroppenstedtia eburnea TaxID=714067 RepID=A0A1N7N7X3_9BACL|nr:hypothetical protein SAMN05421790_10825 [Kroppenstedtia eburnea]
MKPGNPPAHVRRQGAKSCNAQALRDKEWDEFRRFIPVAVTPSQS